MAEVFRWARLHQGAWQVLHLYLDQEGYLTIFHINRHWHKQIRKHLRGKRVIPHLVRDWLLRVGTRKSMINPRDNDISIPFHRKRDCMRDEIRFHTSEDNVTAYGFKIAWCQHHTIQHVLRQCDRCKPVDTPHKTGINEEGMENMSLLHYGGPHMRRIEAKSRVKVEEVRREDDEFDPKPLDPKKVKKFYTTMENDMVVGGDQTCNTFTLVAQKTVVNYTRGLLGGVGISMKFK